MQLTPAMRKMRDDGASYDAIAEKVGAARSTVRAAFANEGAVDAIPIKKTSPAIRTVSLDSAIARVDSVGVVISTIGGIERGQFAIDDDLRICTGLSRDRWRTVRGSARLNEYWHTMQDKTMLWGHKGDITKLAEREKELL